ncbi:arginine biosynthesis bifunctional protein ArgJ, chloroplastic-like [Quercus robur]|uniref:arginine biosynthesis bifunctional protein ArgJ, chloroplastic-like n=1 Tax=Quercus robur TaxID=38942 RepID=UPI002161DE1F|nr:arginine biosynthesis bifunctional protein ArgJ, chloroplastic-like [Quercus robur]
MKQTQKFEAYLNGLEGEVVPSWVIHWVSVTGAGSEAEAAKIAHSVASSSLVLLSRVLYKGRDPNWERIAAAAGYAGISFHHNKLRVLLGDILLMDAGEPQPFDLAAASNYLRKAGETHSTVEILISVALKGVQLHYKLHHRGDSWPNKRISKCYCCVSRWKFKIKPDLPNDLSVTFPGKSIAVNFLVLSLSNSLCFPSDFVSN